MSEPSIATVAIREGADVPSPEAGQQKTRFLNYPRFLLEPGKLGSMAGVFARVNPDQKPQLRSNGEVFIPANSIAGIVLQSPGGKATP